MSVTTKKGRTGNAAKPHPSRKSPRSAEATSTPSCDDETLAGSTDHSHNPRVAVSTTGSTKPGRTPAPCSAPAGNRAEHRGRGNQLHQVARPTKGEASRRRPAPAPASTSSDGQHGEDTRASRSPHHQTIIAEQQLKSLPLNAVHPPAHGHHPRDPTTTPAPSRAAS